MKHWSDPGPCPEPATPRRKRLLLPIRGVLNEAPPLSRLANILQRQRPGTDKVGEPFALFRPEQGVNGVEGGKQSSAQLGGALDAALAGSAGLVGIEALPRDGIGKLGPRPAVVHFCLGPFNLEFVEDAGELADLLLIQVELVGE